MNVSEIRKQLITAAHRAYNRGFQTNSGGNFSARVPGKDLMVVKPSGKAFIDCDEHCLVITDFFGNVVEGDLKPTKESLLHGSIYRTVADAGAIMHCHAVWGIVFADGGTDLDMCTMQAQLKFPAPVRNIAITTPAVTEEEMPQVLELFAQNPKTNAFILRKHGTVAVARDIITAEHIMELVEETAKIAVLSQLYRAARLKIE
jgi:L-ribulose-5-phosphate 4-epimerase